MKIELRDDRVIVEGYVNAVGRDSKLLKDEEGEFVEQIVPGTFAAALRKANESIKLYRDHNPSWLLGDTSTNLQLQEDDIGLYAKAEITDAETIDKAAGGKLRGWSFGFIPLDRDNEYTFSGKARRLIKEIDLEEVSVIDDLKYPAYSGTSITSTAERGTDKTLVVRAYDTDFEIIDHRSEPPEEQPDYSYYNTILSALGQIK